MTPTMTEHHQPGRTTDRFQAHAVARLRGEAAEAARIASEFSESDRRLHMIFVQSLFAGVVIDTLGDQPDPFDLARFTERLHDKHFQAEATGGAPFIALRAEAMIRSLFGEEFLLFEIPYTEQPAYMWAVMSELCGPDPTDDQLAGHFRTSAEIASDSVEGATETITGCFAAAFSGRAAEPSVDPDAEPATAEASSSETEATQ